MLTCLQKTVLAASTVPTRVHRALLPSWACLSASTVPIRQRSALLLSWACLSAGSCVALSLLAVCKQTARAGCDGSLHADWGVCKCQPTKAADAGRGMKFCQADAQHAALYGRHALLTSKHLASVWLPPAMCSMTADQYLLLAASKPVPSCS